MRHQRRSAGFSLVELLIAMTITLIWLGMALTALDDAANMSETATLMTD